MAASPETAETLDPSTTARPHAKASSSPPFEADRQREEIRNAVRQELEAVRQQERIRDAVRQELEAAGQPGKSRFTRVLEGASNPFILWLLSAVFVSGFTSIWTHFRDKAALAEANAAIEKDINDEVITRVHSFYRAVKSTENDMKSKLEDRSSPKGLEYSLYIAYQQLLLPRRVSASFTDYQGLSLRTLLTGRLESSLSRACPSMLSS